MTTEELVKGQYVMTPLGRLKVLSNTHSHAYVHMGVKVSYWNTVLIGVDNQWNSIELRIQSPADYPWEL